MCEAEFGAEAVHQARLKWASLTGEAYEDVPPGVVIISDRPLTPEQYARGAEIESGLNQG